MIKVFSGMRPSGKLHLGNYLGAIKNWIELQETADRAIFAVVDYHGITTPFDPKIYSQQVMDVVLDYLAAGVDPKKSLLIRQSKVPEHTELAWIFNTITPLSWLERLPTYKEKKDQVRDAWNNNASLLVYPVLMAADILAEKSNYVPVGEDQLIHIDITNEILKRFNSTFGEVFEPVKPHIAAGARIMSLVDPTKKMSKTGDDGIALSDSPDKINRKVKAATTDSGKEIKADYEKKPGITNLIEIYTLLSIDIKNLKQIEDMYVGKTYVQFKNDLAEVIINALKPFQKKRKEFENNSDQVRKILEESEEKARQLAELTLKEVKQKMGLI